jgi:hypothetical protein
VLGEVEPGSRGAGWPGGTFIRANCAGFDDASHRVLGRGGGPGGARVLGGEPGCSEGSPGARRGDRVLGGVEY